MSARRYKSGWTVALGIAGLGLVVLAARPAAAQPAKPVVDSIAIVQFGTFSVGDAGEVIAAPQALSGSVRHFKNMQLLETTDQICPERGKRFGIRFRAQGRPVNAPVSVTVRTTFPQPGLRLPNGGHKATSEFTAERKIGHTWGWTFTFRHDWQMVSGLWVFEVLHGDRVLARKEFDVQCAIS